MGLSLVPVACVSLAEVDVVWATQSEGEGAGFGGALGISTLSDGSSIVTGSFTETDTFGVTTLESAGGRDIFVAKIDASGNWVWAARAGSNTSIATAESDLIDETGTHVSTLSDGSSIVTGFFQGTATFGAATLESAGGQDVFVAKLDASGNWVWATSARGADADGDVGWAVSALADGSSIITGSFSGTATFGSIELVSECCTEAFVAKLDASGNFVWATRASGVFGAMGLGISTLSDGSSIVTGFFTGNATFGAATLESPGNYDVFVAKLDASGNWVWATSGGGTSQDRGYAISTLTDGSAIVSGNFQGTATFGTTTLDATGVGDANLFVAKIDASGNWVWAAQAGGTKKENGSAISTLTDGSAIVSGNFQGTATFGTTTLDATGVMDDANLFVAKIDASGNWVWAKTVRGDASGTGVSTLSDGSAIVSGAFLGTTTFGVTTLESGEGAKVFVAKFSSNPSDPPVPVTTLTTFALLLLSMLLGLFGYRRLAH